MPALALGSIAVAVEATARYLSLCETLQAERSAVETLEDSIQWGFRETPAGSRQPTRPFFSVDPTDKLRYRLDSGGEQNWLRPSGSVWVYGEIDWPAEYAGDLENAWRHAAYWFGSIIDELAALAGQDVSDRGGPFADDGGSLSIIAINVEGLSYSDPDDWPADELFFRCGFTVDWGDG